MAPEASNEKIALLRKLLTDRQRVMLTQPEREFLAELEADGCRFEHHDDGVRLAQSGLSVWREYLQARLGRPCFVYRQLGSTQDQAARLSDRDRGAIIVAERQTGGRGRLGRAWIAPPGDCLTFSMLLPASASSRVASVAVAVAEGIEAAAGPAPPAVRIKWPNDLLIQGKKVAGLLIERQGDREIVGIGINVTSDRPTLERTPALREATSLFVHDAAPVDPLALLETVIHRMDVWLARPQEAAEQWRRRSVTLGRSWRFHCEGRPLTGRAIDVDFDRGLIVQSIDGAWRHLHAAKTTILGAAE